MGCINIKQLRAMAIEQYIVRELKEDIKLLIKKVTELEKKLEEAHPSKEADTGSKPSTKGYREWNKTHDSYKILYSPYGNKT